MMTPPFRHRATVLRNATPGTDPGGQALPQTPQLHEADLHCDFWVPTERDVQGPDVNAVIEDARMLVPFAADITEGDVVSEVRDLLGQVMNPGALRVLADRTATQPVFRELGLERIAGTYTVPEPS